MTQQVIDFLNSLDNFSEARKVTRYTVYRGNRELNVEVWDHGPDAGAQRYMVWADWAEPDEEVVARGGSTHSLGNADATLEGALENVHWWQFRSDD